MDYTISEPEDKLVRYGPEVVEKIRKEYNLENKADREEAVAIIEEWLKTQDHLVKKEYSKSYIERCLITSKGSCQRAKLQIDKLCTFRTLMPKYFEVTNLLDSDITETLQKLHIGFVPELTKEYHRVVIIKVKPNVEAKSSDFTRLFKFFVLLAEYLKSNDYCQGVTLIADIFDTSAADVMSKINLVELQQFIPVVTEGYGTKIKGIIFVTTSKFIDGFVRIIKPFFSEKIANRIHVATSKIGVQDYVREDSLPEEYGGRGEPVEVLHEHLIKTLSAKKHEELLEEMKKANTDESRRRRDKFNDQYMGMPGTFRTLSLD